MLNQEIVLWETFASDSNTINYVATCNSISFDDILLRYRVKHRGKRHTLRKGSFIKIFASRSHHDRDRRGLRESSLAFNSGRQCRDVCQCKQYCYYWLTRTSITNLFHSAWFNSVTLMSSYYNYRGGLRNALPNSIRNLLCPMSVEWRVFCPSANPNSASKRLTLCIEPLLFECIPRRLISRCVYFS